MLKSGYFSWFNYHKFYYSETRESFYIVILLSFFSLLMDSMGILIVVPLLIPKSEFTADNQISAFLEGLVDGISIMDRFTASILLVLGIFFIKSFLIYWIQYVVIRVKNKLNNDLKLNLINSIRDVNYQYFSSQPSSSIIEIINNQIQIILTGFANYLGSITQSISFLAYLSILVSINKKATFGIIFFGGILSIIFVLIGKIVRRSSNEQSKLSILFLHNFNEYLKAFKYLRSTSNTSIFVKTNLYREVKELIKKTNHLEDLTARVSASKEFIMVLGLVIVLVIENFLNPGKAPMLTFLIFLLRAFTSLTSAQSNFQNLNACHGAIDIFNKTYIALENNKESYGKITINNIRDLKFTDVSFSYGENPILKRSSFEISINDRIGIIGESGSGKSTVINLICGIYKPTEGLIEVNGVDISKIDLESYRSNIGYVGQEPIIFNKSLYFNLFLKEYSRIEYLDRKGEIQSLLSSLGLENLFSDLDLDINKSFGDSGSNLSGGQRQRINIARELLKKPQLLLLDEVTSALDDYSKNLVFDLLNGMKDIAIVQITHDSKLIEGYNKILKIDNTKIKSL